METRSYRDARTRTADVSGVRFADRRLRPAAAPRCLPEPPGRSRSTAPRKRGARTLGIMERKSFQDMDCPVALALERVGEWWSILILRDATHGMTKFDEFEKSLGISPNSLSRRLGRARARRTPGASPLQRATAAGRVRSHRGRTGLPSGADRAVPVGLGRTARPMQPNVRLIMNETGKDADPMYVDRETLASPRRGAHRVPAGPTATDQLRDVLARRAAACTRPPPSRCPDGPGRR